MYNLAELLPITDSIVFLQNVKQSDFDLPTLGSKLVAFRDEAVNGRGFVLLRGLPVEQWPVEEVAIAYWGLGTYWGKAQPQNRLHHLLGHVKVSKCQQCTASLVCSALSCMLELPNFLAAAFLCCTTCRFAGC